ncbi:MAG: NAD(+)/NADH kinase [Solirubrobacterales bacterium]
MATVVLITHGHPETASGGVAAAAASAEQAGWEMVATPEEHAKHGAAAAAIGEVDKLPDRPDLCLVLGGDGSILYALRRYADSEVPVFGVNFGTVGFLAAAEREELGPALSQAWAGDYRVMSLPGLEVPSLAERRGGDGVVGLNDVVFLRQPQRRVPELSCSIEGEEVGHVRCDGLVIATPAGSTGYNLANSGPILAWGVEGYVVSFIAPHTLTARALVVAPGDSIEVGNAAGRDPVELLLDGELAASLGPGEKIEVRFRNDVSKLAQLPGASFYRRIREKFGMLTR